jgi:hypothetical protein
MGRGTAVIWTTNEIASSVVNYGNSYQSQEFTFTVQNLVYLPVIVKD